MPKVGYHLTEKHKLKLAKYRIGRKHSQETKAKIGKAQIGRKHTKETKIKMSEAVLGKRNHNFGKHFSREYRIKMSIAHKGGKCYWFGKHLPERTITKISNLAKQRWQNPEYKTRAIANIIKAAHRKPNKIELYFQEFLDKYFPDEWKYVGDGQLIIGGKCPDYTNLNGKKALIELFGDYWHVRDNPEDRINNFAKFGFRCLVIWEHELKEKDNLVRKIQAFTGIS